jgi:hypothetical protein
MPYPMFHPGDEFYCRASVCNAEGQILEGFPLFIILDVHGVYFFAPSFTGYDNFLVLYPAFDPGITDVEVLPLFTWPEGAGSMDGVTFMGALTDPDVTQVFGQMGLFTFGWTE